MCTCDCARFVNASWNRVKSFVNDSRRLAVEWLLIASFHSRCETDYPSKPLFERRQVPLLSHDGIAESISIRSFQKILVYAKSLSVAVPARFAPCCRPGQIGVCLFLFLCWASKPPPRDSLLAASA